MGDILRKRLLQSRFESPVEEALLNLLVASGALRDRIERLCGEQGITGGQYNVLRILKGVFPEGYARCDIARRLIERAPDVTRLIDRMERQGLVERTRSDEDRRLSVTRITKRGLRVLEDVKPSLHAMFQEIAGRLSTREATELSRICESLYGSPEG